MNIFSEAIHLKVSISISQFNILTGGREVKDMIAALTAIAGEQNVCVAEEALASFAEDGSFAKRLFPRAIVKPQDANQVQDIVKWSNRTKTPLVPVSSTAPHYKGDTVPSVPDAVIVDLSGMKKILGISRRHRIAVIEPGVTYGELNAALAKEGLTVSMPLMPREGKSVIGSLLESEPRLNALHQWCNLDPLRCVEVTWGDGNRMYTGEAGGSVMDLESQWKEDKWQWEPAGPMMLDFYRLLTGAQGTMGIVTWASVRCELMPKEEKGYLVPAQKLDDLIDFAYHVLRIRFGEAFFIMNAAQLARLMTSNTEDAAKMETELPPWIAMVGIGGREILPQERVAYQEQDIADIAQKYDLTLQPECGGISGDLVFKRASNTSGSASWKAGEAGAFADIFFSTTLDRTPEFVGAMETLAKEKDYQRNIGVYLQPENMGTSYHCSFTLPFDSEDSAEFARTECLFTEASEKFSQMGAYYFRPYGIWSKLQLSRDAESYHVLQQLREIFDPNGIMNPGKLRND